MSRLNDVRTVNANDRNRAIVEREVRRRIFRERMATAVNFALVIIVFAACIFSLDNKALIYEQNAKNLTLEKEVADLQSKISEMDVLISSQFSLETIHKIASEELGMVYPTSGRVVSVVADRYYSLDRPADGEYSVIAFEFESKIYPKKNRD